MDGDPLDAALRDYGPAAIDDLLPRLRTIAATLDEAHAMGQVHGSLHPQNIFVSAETTVVTGLGVASIETTVRPPYTAPEAAAGGPAVAASDQFALAAIAYEWMFGRRVSGPATRAIEVRTLPGVDRDALSQAFTRALAPEAGHRFASCMAFYQALCASLIPTLPLGLADVDDDADRGPVDDFQDDDLLVATPDVMAVAESGTRSEIEADLTPLRDQDEPRFASLEPDPPDPIRPVAPVSTWQPSAAATPARPAERFGGGMLIAALAVGLVFGFAAGYMARPRALQSGPIQTMAPLPAGTDGGPVTEPAAGGGTDRRASAPVAPATVPASRPAEPPPEKAGRLLVRSTPGGASVEVDGVDRGVTPLALRDLDLGPRTVTVTRRGYLTEEHRIVLTKARPSRSLELRLSTAAAPRPGTPATLGQPPAASRGGAAATGTLLVESRPAGATIIIDGKPRGTTPLLIEALAPGDYRVGLSLAGYQSFATTVRVVAGERTRAAASLSAQEQE